MKKLFFFLLVVYSNLCHSETKHFLGIFGPTKDAMHVFHQAFPAKADSSIGTLNCESVILGADEDYKVNDASFMSITLMDTECTMLFGSALISLGMLFAALSDFEDICDTNNFVTANGTFDLKTAYILYISVDAPKECTILFASQINQIKAQLHKSLFEHRKYTITERNPY